MMYLEKGKKKLACRISVLYNNVYNGLTKNIKTTFVTYRVLYSGGYNLILIEIMYVL